MKMLFYSFLLVAVGLVGNLTAQPYGGGWGGGGGYGTYHHASTAEEGMARGMADMTRSAGMANLMNSAAAGNWEDAKTKNIQNQVYGTEAYFDMRRINKEQRAAEQGPRPSQEDMARYAALRKPKATGLSPSELDPVSGEVVWPTLLKDDAYASYRDEIQNLCVARVEKGAFSLTERTQFREVSSALASELKKNINAYSPMEYLQAKKFVEKLYYDMAAQAG